jgi:type II secretory ATPase GspE/PulE/Tfp pilus assembly ATPase PilB-like protein
VHDVLEREGIISQKDLALLLAETLRLRIVDLTTYPLDANVTRELKETIATRYEVVPIGIDERTIEVVTANPLDLDGLKAVEFATGKRVQAVVATHVEVKDALAHTYRLQESLEQFLQLVPAGESLVVNELSDEGDDLRTIAADAELPPVIKLADKMLIEGIKSRASDIHVEPRTDSVLVRYRVDGILEEAFRFPKWIQNPLVARLKVMAKLDITERRLPQDGRIQVRYSTRTSTCACRACPRSTARRSRSASSTRARREGARPSRALAGDLKLIRDAAKKPQGMILITGPTGSGKTTDALRAAARDLLAEDQHRHDRETRSSTS